jgi:colanic acid/amylovoran biosynthesis glycosyltransferase
MDRPLRIAFFVGCFPAVSETFIVRQITGLLDQGHAVDIYADTRAEPGTPVHPEVEKYRLLERTTWMEMPPETAPYEMPVWPLTGQTWPPGAATAVPNWRRALHAVPELLRCAVTAPRLTQQVLSCAAYGYQAASLSALYRLAKLSSVSRSYDVLHAHFGPVGKSFRFARSLWRAPLVVTFHGYDFCTVPRKEGPNVYVRLFDITDTVTTHSEYASRRLEGLGCPPAKLHRLHVGLSPDEFPFQARTLQPGEAVRILTVARLVEIKGLEYSIQAIAAVARQHASMRYDIVGEGPERSKLEALIRRLELEGVVRLLGAQPADVVQKLMAQTHLFVLPSVNLQGDEEGTPVTLMEAQASGIPVVATRTGGIPEVVRDGESGFLVADRDAKALAARLSFLIEHPQEWPAMGRRGRGHVEQQYDIRKLNQQLAELYRRVREQFISNGQPG